MNELLLQTTTEMNLNKLNAKQKLVVKNVFYDFTYIPFRNVLKSVLMKLKSCLGLQSYICTCIHTDIPTHIHVYQL